MCIRTIGVVMTLGALLGTACGSDPLKAEDVHQQIQAACAEQIHTLAGAPPIVAGPTFTRDTLDGARLDDIRAYTLIRTLHGPKDQRARLDELLDAIHDLGGERSAARSALEERDWERSQEAIDAGRKAAAEIDRISAGLDLAECSSATWFGDWFDQAQAYHDDQVAATKPTGDFMTDVESACSRLADDIADSPLPFGSVDTQLWALSVKSGLRLFLRDVKALDVPEASKREVAELEQSIDDLNDNLEKVVDAVVTGAKDPDQLVADVQSGIDDVLDRIAALGAKC
jgi:hypothetical protein